MKQKKLTVCLVVKNEEKHLRRCLQSIAEAADEIVIVDTGSMDRTMEIARQFSEKVYSIKWRDNFSWARNYALDKATGEWILVIDGDEELTAGSAGILKEKLLNSDCEGYLIKVLNYYDTGTQVETAPDVVFRMFRNKKEYRYSGAIHEQVCDNIMALNPSAKIEIAEDICIIHYGYLPEEISAKGKAERNTKLLLKAVKKNPNSLLDRFHLGMELFRSNQIEKALAEFLFVADKADLRAVYVPKLLRYITKCHYLLGNLEDALSFIDNIWIKLYPEQGDLYYLKGLISKEFGRHPDAYHCFLHCLNLPVQPAHFANLYCQYKDKIYLQLGYLSEYYCDKEKALEYYVRAMRENPRATSALARIVKLLKPRENPEYTMNALNNLFDFSDPAIHLDLAKLFFAERAYQLAIRLINSITGTVVLPVEAHLIKVLSLIRINRINEALQELNLIPPDDTAYSSAQGNLFLYYWLNGEKDSAELHLDSLKNFGKNPALAEILEALQENCAITPEGLNNSITTVYQEVMEILERIIEAGDRSGFEQAWHCFGGLFGKRPAQALGDLYCKYQYYELALSEYLHLLGQNKPTPEGLYRLGKIYWHLHSLDDAENYLRTALAGGYNNPAVYLELARLYQEKAVKTLEEGIDSYPDNKVVKLLKNLKNSLIEV